MLHHSEFDAEGRTVVSITEAGALSMTNRSLYNLAGEVTNQINEAGLIIAIANNHTGRTRTVTDPAGATSIESSYIDGRRKSTTGTATIHRFTDYGVNADGTRWSKQYTGPALGNSPRWSKSTTDFLGRSSTSERPGYGGSTVSSTNHYNGLGRLVKVTDSTPRADTLIQYDSLGNQTASGLDLNTNGIIDASDRYTSSDSSYTTDGTDWFTTSWSGIHTGSSQIHHPSVHQIRHTGLSTNRDANVKETKMFMKRIMIMLFIMLFFGCASNSNRQEVSVVKLDRSKFFSILKNLSSINPHIRSTVCRDIVENRSLLAEELDEDEEEVVLLTLAVCLNDVNWIPRRLAATTMFETHNEIDYTGMVPYLLNCLDFKNFRLNYSEDGASIAKALAVIEPEQATPIFFSMLQSDNWEAVACAAVGSEFLQSRKPELYEQIRIRLKDIGESDEFALVKPILEGVLKGQK